MTALLLSLFASFASASELTIIPRADWGSRPDPIPVSRRHVPSWITVHHAGVPWRGGDPALFLRRMQSWGKESPRNWPDLPYHFLISPDGRVFEGRPVEYEPDSNTRYPLAGNLGVELMGDFETQSPTAEQLRALAFLTARLRREHSIARDRVRRHLDAAPGQTSCPGRELNRRFESGEFFVWVEAALKGEPVEIGL